MSLLPKSIPNVAETVELTMYTWADSFIHLFIHLFDTKCKLLSFTIYTVEILGDAILNLAQDFSPQLSLKFPDGQLN